MGEGVHGRDQEGEGIGGLLSKETVEIRRNWLGPLVHWKGWSKFWRSAPFLDRKHLRITYVASARSPPLTPSSTFFWLNYMTVSTSLHPFKPKCTLFQG